MAAMLGAEAAETYSPLRGPVLWSLALLDVMLASALFDERCSVNNDRPSAGLSY
jgi:hypothetical protein